MSQSEGSAIEVSGERANSGARFNIAYKHFDDLCGQFYHSWFRYHPEHAVDVGVYDYADLLTSYEHDDIGALLVLNQKMLSALDELNITKLDESRQIDYKIIKGAITVELHDLEENDWRYRNPIEYVPVNAIYQLLIHPGKNVQQAIEHRLQIIPEYLRGAKVMLASYPERVVPQWAATAKDISLSGANFIRTLARNPLTTAKFSYPERLQPLCDDAAHALNEFASYLDEEVLPKAEGKFASGHYRFNRLLNERHFLQTDADKILRCGERLVEQTEKELLLKSEQVCGEQDISKALDMVRAKHPEGSQLLDSYRKKMQAAHAWLLKSDIVTVPEKQSLKVLQTPVFMRELIPFAAYEPPMPHDEEQRGLYYVTTVEDESLLAEHNHFSIDLTSVHEAFPGHHLQFVLLFLLRLVDLVERFLHRCGRIDVFQLHLVNADAHGVFGRQLLHLGQRFGLDFLSADGDHFIHGTIADDFPHHRFGNITQGFARLTNFEQKFNRVRDAVLNHPLDQCGIEITGHHLGFPLAIAWRLVWIS